MRFAQVAAEALVVADKPWRYQSGPIVLTQPLVLAAALAVAVVVALAVASLRRDRTWHLVFVALATCAALGFVQVILPPQMVLRLPAGSGSILRALAEPNEAVLELTWRRAYARILVLLIFAGLGSLTPSPRATALLRLVATTVGVTSTIYMAGQITTAHERVVDVLKWSLALGAAGFSFYDAFRSFHRRPIATRWRKAIFVSMASLALVLYFNGFRFGYAGYYHRWDQYHYYMGAKYFPEIGYDALYKCTAIAQDELGVATFVNEAGKEATIDMRTELRQPGKTIRNLSGDNLLMPASTVLENPDECKRRFSPARWEAYKRDVVFFRTQSERSYWDQMQRDHGYNPPPVWTLGGHLISNVVDTKVRNMQMLALIDVGYLLAIFGALAWAFGYRVASVAAILFGCQASAPYYWTGGAFLRQDWLFYLVMAACLARKRWFKLAGASMVYAGLLRIFPGLTVIGWLVVAGAYVFKHRRMHPDHQKALVGGTTAAAILIGASLAVVGPSSYSQFFKHTIQVHDQTPLTNHMGLRVLVSHRIVCSLPRSEKLDETCATVASGRMQQTKRDNMVDPFQIWKEMRLERYAHLRWVAYGVLAVAFAGFVHVVRRIRSLWIAQALGQIWIILLSQLTCYYYSFVILGAPLTKARRNLEPWLFGFAAVSQVMWNFTAWNDDRYVALTLLTLALTVFALWMFARRIGPDPARVDRR